MSDLTPEEIRPIVASVGWAELKAAPASKIAEDIAAHINTIIAARVAAARADERERCAEAVEAEASLGYRSVERGLVGDNFRAGLNHAAKRIRLL